MHVVFVTTELATSQNPSGGLASFTANMARIFAANGHKVTILLVLTKDEEMTFDNNISLIKISVKKAIWEMLDKITKLCMLGNIKKADEGRKFLVNILKSIQIKRKIHDINRLNKIDIVHYCNLAAVAFRADSKIPYVIRISSFMNIWNGANTIKGCIDYRKNRRSLTDKLTDYTLKKARYVVSPSRLLADIGRRELNIKPTVIESPFVLNKSEWNYDIYNTELAGKKYILHYGYLKYTKGTHIVAEIAEKFLEQYPDFYLVLTGKSEYLFDETDGNMSADELVRKKAGEYSNRVIYAGRLVREQLYPLIQYAELCLLPSRIENLSNACIEAMAMGKIVVATNGASYEQLIDNKISGFLCERDKPKSYLQAINKALSMSFYERQQMELRAVEATKRLEPQKVYEQYLAYYEKVIREW